ncbi:hypothetical protein [Roseibium sp.]|uniref:hypothetical protein n=1 Tax=Roseibium sp. TaxID=1936156 RepID=UPI003BAD9F84
MKLIWRQKWQILARKRAQSGLYARSSAVTQRGKAILPSFGFGRLGHLHRRERLENEPHFLRFRSSQLVKTIQTKLTSFVSPYPRPGVCGFLRAIETKKAARGRLLHVLSASP